MSTSTYKIPKLPSATIDEPKSTDSMALTLTNLQDLTKSTVEFGEKALLCNCCGKLMKPGSKVYLMCASSTDDAGNQIKGDHAAHIMCQECREDEELPWIGEKGRCTECLNSFTLRGQMKGVFAMQQPVCIAVMGAFVDEHHRVKGELTKLREQAEASKIMLQSSNRTSAVSDPEVRRQMQSERGHISASTNQAEPADEANATVVVEKNEESDDAVVTGNGKGGKPKKKRSQTPEAVAEMVRKAKNTKETRKREREKEEEERQVKAAKDADRLAFLEEKYSGMNDTLQEKDRAIALHRADNESSSKQYACVLTEMKALLQWIEETHGADAKKAAKAHLRNA